MRPHAPSVWIGCSLAPELATSAFAGLDVVPFGESKNPAGPLKVGLGWSSVQRQPKETGLAGSPMRKRGAS